MQFLAKGKRGTVYIEGKCIIKKASSYQIKNEVDWLKKLNKRKIGPKLVDCGDDWFKAEYIKGERIEEYVQRAEIKEIAKILRDCLKQCRIMDSLKMNKKEMHHPYKHVIIRKNKPRFIDFERCKITENPKNITQFCQYILKLALLFPGKVNVNREEMIKAMKEYKRNQNEKSFRKILKLI
ncbi:MAG TPA: hypothetical protein VJJ21_03930 [Candidatus Nanoarchaeia archaeon]|nr:hypothetical protein [Candidatus Nanoarchaeia archaeon]